MMGKRIDRTDVSKEVRLLLKRTGEKDPAEAVRIAAREILSPFQQLFGDEGPPINLRALASSRSIKVVDEQPVYSEDAELVPDEERGLIIRLNRERPITRQRFSIGHEVGHTLFDGYDTEVQCRKTRKRDWHDPADVIEYLCDVAASELLFPLEWFQADIDSVEYNAERLLALSFRYQASPEATVRRFVELSKTATAAIFFRWMHKPADGVTKSSSGPKRSAARARRVPPKKLRVDYPVANSAFASLGEHIPRWKSVSKTSVIHEASIAGACKDSNREYLDLGSFTGWFRIHALPVFTTDGDVGPSGERSVIAVLQPVSKPRAR